VPELAWLLTTTFLLSTFLLPTMFLLPTGCLLSGEHPSGLSGVVAGRFEVGVRRLPISAGMDQDPAITPASTHPPGPVALALVIRALPGRIRLY
jgi:hypothetical protein